MQRILAVDDDVPFRRALCRVLSDLGYEITQAGDGLAAAQILEKEQFDLVLTDLDMPQANGFEVIKSAQRLAPKTPVVMLTGSQTADCVSAIRAGAADFLTKPYNAEELGEVIRKAIERGAAAAALLGESEPMRELLGKLEAAARRDGPVLLEAEAGAGTEVFARLIHSLSSRAGAPFVSVAARCTDDDALLTAAERAERGTLFIDQVTTLAPSLRATLNKVIERGTVRIVAGTVEPIEADLAALHEARLSVPPLRERPEDVPALIRHFVDAANRRHGLNVKLGCSIVGSLQSYSFPGNVNELEALVGDLVQRGHEAQPVEDDAMVVDYADAELVLHDGSTRVVSIVTCGGQTIESLLVGPDTFLVVQDEGRTRHYARAVIAVVSIARMEPTAEDIARRTCSVRVKLMSGRSIEGDIRWIPTVGRSCAASVLADTNELLVVHTEESSCFIAKSHVAWVEEIS